MDWTRLAFHLVVLGVFVADVSELLLLAVATVQEVWPQRPHELPPDHDHQHSHACNQAPQTRTGVGEVRCALVNISPFQFFGIVRHFFENLLKSAKGPPSIFLIFCDRIDLKNPKWSPFSFFGIMRFISKKNRNSTLFSSANLVQLLGFPGTVKANT